MMALRIQAKEMTIEHMGKPRHWVPIVSIKRSEGPSYSFQGETGLNMRIQGNILRIIIIKEIIVVDLPEGSNNHDEKNAENKKNLKSLWCLFHVLR